MTQGSKRRFRLNVSPATPLQDYYFVNKVTHREAVAGEKGEEGQAASQAMGAFGLDFGLDFKEAQLPPQPTEEDFAAPPSYESLIDSERGAWQRGLSVLRRLFDERPIWSRAMIQGHVDATWTHLVRPLLLKISYSFHNGPWRLLWVKKGVDPRTDPALRKYQLLDFRVPRAWYTAMPKGHEKFFQSSVMRPWGGMLNSPEEEVEGAVALWKATQRFERAPRQRSTFFQLCDLEDDDMQRHLAAQPVLDMCDSISGWYTVPALNEVRRLMKERYRRFLPEGNPWRDLATPVCAVSKRHSMWDIEAIKSGRVPVKRKKVETGREDSGKDAASKPGAEGASGGGAEQASGVRKGQESEQERRAKKEKGGGAERRDGDEGPENEPVSDERGFRGDGEPRDEEDDVSSSGEEEEGPGDVDEEEDDLSEDEADEEDEYESDVSEERGATATLDRRKGEGVVPLPSAQGIPHGYMQALLGSFPAGLQADGELPRGSLQAELESEEAFPIFEPEEESDEEDEEG